MDLYNANRYQPDICLSLSSEWLTRMMVSEAQGERWCGTAYAAAENSVFYARHKREQAELTSISVIRNLQLQNRVLTLTAFTGTYGAEALQLLGARRPVIASLRSKKADKVKLQRLRHLRVSRSKEDATLDDLKTEFLSLSETPRYYLISVRTGGQGSHAIAVVSTKAVGCFSPSGYLWYYDPNLHRVVRWRSRNDLNGFLDRTLLQDYASINHIWEVERL